MTNRKQENGTGGRRLAVRNGASHALLDDVAKQIIEQLQEDGRRPYATIGKAVGLSEAAVRQRVQRLLDAGVMQIVAVTDPLQLGFPRQAMVGLRTDGDLEAVADRLAELEEVDYVVITAGSFDLLTEVLCRDDAHLLEILQRLRAVEGVLSTEAFVYLKLHRQTYTWGTRPPAATVAGALALSRLATLGGASVSTLRAGAAARPSPEPAPPRPPAP